MIITAIATIQDPAAPMSTLISGSNRTIPTNNTNHEIKLFILVYFVIHSLEILQTTAKSKSLNLLFNY